MDRAQRVAAKLVRQVLGGSSLHDAFAANSTALREERALIHELAYGTLRFLGQVRTLARLLADRPLADQSVEALLWVALYQLIHTNAPAHAVVDAAVRATARVKRTSAQGLTNAILRNFLRRRDSLLAQSETQIEGRFSYPLWWIERVQVDYPDQFASILDAGNARPPLTLRVNPRTTTREAYLEALKARDIEARAVGAWGVIISMPRAVTDLPGFAEGWFSVQDAGAQIAAQLLDLHDGMSVLDACAAPGGKTTHIAELAKVDLHALDVDAARLERVAQNLARLRLPQAKLLAADAGSVNSWWDGGAFDRILIDAPCTASGVVRRHPDAKWLRRESDVGVFAQQQQRLLDALWPCLAPGGALLYATCSVFHAENHERIAAFLTTHSDAAAVPLTLPMAALDGQLLPAGAGAAHNHDGFFYALLRKS